MPTAPRRWGSALQELQCTVFLGTMALHCKNGLAIAPGQCGSALHEFHCPAPLSSVHDRSRTAHCPKAVWQCIARVLLFR